MGARQGKPQAASFAHCLLLLLWKESTVVGTVGPGRRKLWSAGQTGIPAGALELKFGERTFLSMLCPQEKQPLESLNSQLGAGLPMAGSGLWGAHGALKSRYVPNMQQQTHLPYDSTRDTQHQQQDTRSVTHTTHSKKDTSTDTHTVAHNTHTHTHTRTRARTHRGLLLPKLPQATSHMSPRGTPALDPLF